MRQQNLIILLLLLTIIPNFVFAADKKPAGKEETKATATAAVFRCGTDIFYSWQPTPPPPPTTQVKTQTTAASAIAPIEEFYQRIFDLEASEQAAKDRFNKNLPTYQAQAMKRCEEKHQSMARCLANNFKAIQTDMQAMDFEARKLLRESVTTDCQNVYGRCTATRTGEITCSKDETTAGAKSGDDKGKDAKKK
ncbi:MAG: hypothetical protein IT292_07645 [Deltaproteobacteria bacterium]|nr:hypothetical protein [Deltaproteobacteria bacterium]